MKQSKIGGQAVIEGVMMRGATAGALTVRDEKKRLRIKTWRTKEKSIWRKIPILRGVLNFVDSLTSGTGILMDSANVFGEEEPSKFEKWVSKTLKIDLIKVVMVFAMLLGVGIAVGLFIILPSVTSKWITGLFSWGNTARIWIEAIIKLLILFGYILLTSLLSDIKRVYMYHGAEHKTINCYEHEMELTVENVRSCSKFHNRCGTTFLFFVVLVGILLFSLIQIENEWLRIGAKILCLPITAGLAYELLMLIAKTKSVIFLPFKLPGMLLQKITTREPTDDMIEVAITSFKAVLELDENPEMATYDRFSYKYVSDAKIEAARILDKSKVEYDADIDWILCHVMNVKRSELTDSLEISAQKYGEIIKFVKQRATGEPLWHVLGTCNFYGIDLISDSRGLIPRPETEELVKNALEMAKDKKTALDLCCGSGAIGIAIAKNSEMKVTAVDLSDDALALSAENIKLTGVDIELIKSNMFESLEGKKFDVILSNPPYIKREDIEKLQKEVKDFEPTMALDGGVDGLDFYRIIAENAKKYLNEDGFVIMELGINQAADVAKLFEDYKNVEIINDIMGVERILIGRN
ncbi:MAG: peptide chain release factor N(5)-glutamine methyltransferase [Clostridia bacterium]